jgi:hypothetical protein
MTMLDETRERFLKAILAQVPLARIAEIRFFQPMRQGGVESGVAVIAEGREESGETSAATDAGLETLPSRYVIHTARYRLILKGADRGKWEASIVAEADAPLLTVEAVVRGVQRRSGDVDEATRMTQDELSSVLISRSTSAA